MEIVDYLVLKPSSVEGIGVFSTVDIAAGDQIPVWGEGDSRTIVNPEGRLKEMCNRFGVHFEPNTYCCPKNFNQMSMGWYLNHSINPNARITDDFAIAIENIAVGEEITIDYATLNEVDHVD